MAIGKLTRKQKILYGLGLFLLGTVVFLVSAPLWFPWILKPALKNYGINYERYERDGYMKFILHDARFTNSKTKFQAERIESLLPIPWLWKNLRNDENSDFLQVSNWQLQFIDSSTKEQKTANNSLPHIVNKLDPAIVQLHRWLPRGSFENGVIHLGKEKVLVTGKWRDGHLSGRVLLTNSVPETIFDVDLLGNGPRQLSFRTPSWELDGSFVIQDENKFVKIDGVTIWRSNRVEISALFDENGWLPESASAQSKSFRIPAKNLKLQGYQDLLGSLDLRWETNRFAIDLKAKAQPMENRETFLSPIEAVLHANGDTNSIRIESATVFSPWLEAKLSENAEFNFKGEMLSPVATLEVAADLSHQKWITATGNLRGKAVLRRSAQQFPDATFELSGAGLDAEGLQAELLDVRGKLEWPWLEISSAKIGFKGGAAVQADFRFNAVERLIANGQLSLNGQISPTFLPTGISYKNVSVAGKFSGPLKGISHSAHVELQEAHFPNMAPLDIVADWNGSHLELTNYQATIEAKDSSLSVAGSLNLQSNGVVARFEKFDLTVKAQPVLTLDHSFAFKASNEKSNWNVEMEPARWAGNKSEIAIGGKVQWPQQGNISVFAQTFDLSSVRDFFENAPPKIFLEKMDLLAGWTNGPVDFLANVLAKFTSEQGTRFEADLNAKGNAEGIAVERAEAGTESQRVIAGKGFLPIRFEPANQSNLIQMLPQQRIDFQAATVPNSKFWEQVALWTRADFREPTVSIDLSGTMDEPTGKIAASAKEIIIKPPTAHAEGTPLSAENNRAVTNSFLQSLHFQNLVADFDLARSEIALNRFEFLVEGQPVRMTGELPLPKTFQKGWKDVFDWRKANAHLQIVDARIAPFARLFPDIFSPVGKINFDVQAKEGRLDGELRISDAALPPLATLGSVHDISAQVNFTGDNVKLKTFRGAIGGQPVELSGEINLTKKEPVTGLPVFSFKLHGTNVPLARRSELILRSDLDLEISNAKGGQPLVSGSLNLRDSLYLSDLKFLVPGKISKPQQRPPYFSVEKEPFSEWRLNVTVTGNEFLRVRSPLFRGEISASLKVEGTLREPLALGTAQINSGVVQFPFANLRVEQGFISLTSENPYRPQLAISTASRSFGYDVKMELSGFADKPSVEFSSSPGLTSEQILLMVTVGELPRDEINFSSQQKAGRVAFFLGKNLISKFGGTGATEEKLEIRSGEEISEQGQQTYFVEYKLSNDWSIIGEYDRFGGVNGGFKWKFFEK